jgi:shikimate dehydrogenase
MAAAPWDITKIADEHLMPHKAACVIGWPVGHSRSPLIHNYWIKQHGLDAEYRREAVAADQFKEFITHLAARGYVGGNVTVPHKEAALAVSEPDDRARAVGAANTLWLDGARLRSTNTDVEGFIGNLDAAAPGWDRARQCALVLGAGGAARAVLFGLLDRGIGRILLANRTAERAAALRTQFGERVEPVRWGDLDALMPEAGLLVNTTSLGMAGQPPLSIDLARLPADAVVSDLVYVPLETPLLAAARSRGLRTVDGLGMLLYQAVGGFQRWFGMRPQVTEALRALVEADLISK